MKIRGIANSRPERWQMVTLNKIIGQFGWQGDVQSMIYNMYSYRGNSLSGKRIVNEVSHGYPGYETVHRICTEKRTERKSETWFWSLQGPFERSEFFQDKMVNEKLTLCGSVNEESQNDLW